MNMTFHGAIYSFSTALLVGLIASRSRTSATQQRILVLDPSVAFGPGTVPIWCLSLVLLGVTVLLNFYWR
jgi:hypothetical protein